MNEVIVRLYSITCCCFENSLASLASLSIQVSIFFGTYDNPFCLCLRLTGFCEIWILRNCEIWILRNKKKSGFYEIKKSGFCEINIFYNIYKIWILRNEKKNIWILRNEPIAATYCLLQISKKNLDFAK